MTFTGGSATASGAASGTANVDPATGNITSITITNPGYGYAVGDTVTADITTGAKEGTGATTTVNLSAIRVGGIPVRDLNLPPSYEVDEYGSKFILNNINWEVKRGEKWLVKGPNGAGKSTLLSLITGDHPQAYASEIYLFDKKRGTGESIWDIKKKIGYISPELHWHFATNITCAQAIGSGFFDTIGLYKKLNQQQHNILQQWMDFLHLSHVANKPLNSVSNGHQRLILLSRALVKNPPLLVLDEPCQGLDGRQKQEFVTLVDDLCKKFSKTLIYVSHYDDEIPQCINSCLNLDPGGFNINRVSNSRKLQTEFVCHC